jgi:uncharacterized protein (TIGR03118 family)
MRKHYRRAIFAALIGAAVLSATSVAALAAGYVEADLVVNQQVNGVPTLTDSNGIVHVAKFFDPHLLNPWGVGESATSPFWISENGAGLSRLFNTDGSPRPTPIVSIPAPGAPLGNDGAPTGLVFNIAGGATGVFKVSGVNSAGAPASAAATFLFSSEDGTILGWNPGVNPAGFDPAKAGMYAIQAYPPAGAASDARYKGLAIAKDASGTPYLYATNFHAGTVDVFDGTFAPVHFSPTAFVDPKLPKGYAPFNVVPINGNLVVTYAVQDKDAEDDVAGMGHGIVDVYDLHGMLLQRFAQHGQLNSPWGVTLAPTSFGDLAGALLIGNFGNGHINAFNPVTGEFIDKLRNDHGQAIAIDGLWTVMFGNGGSGGRTDTLYFTAGPNEEADGIFGSISPSP